MRRRTILLAVVAAMTVMAAPVTAVGTSPTWSTGGGGSGGVLDNQVLAKFDFNVDGDVLNLTQLAWWSPVNFEGEENDDNLICEYSGNTASSDGLSFIDMGRSLVIRIEGVEACGTTIFAELEVIYRTRDLATSPIVDDECDGDLRRGVLRGSEGTAVASVYIETSDGVVIEATGGASYSLEEYVCVDAAP